MNKTQEALKMAQAALAASDDFLFNYHDCEPNNEREVDAYSEIRANNMAAWEAVREALAEQPAQQQEPVQETAWQALPAGPIKVLHQCRAALIGPVADGLARRCAVAAIDAELARPAQQQEPVAWVPIEQMYPQAKAIDILMGDGSILCAVLPQFDGDLWWEGSGTGEKFIDPKYANVTHWRIHDERTSTPASKPLTMQERTSIVRANTSFHDKNEIDAYGIIDDVEAAHGIKGDA